MRTIRRINLFFGIVWRCSTGPSNNEAPMSAIRCWLKYRITIRTAWDVAQTLYPETTRPETTAGENTPPTKTMSELPEISTGQLMAVDHPRLVVPLTMKQAEAYQTIGTEWKAVPTGVPSASLLALERRGMVECRRSERYPLCISGHWAYSSAAYEWRRNPRHNIIVVAPGSAVQKPELENELDR